MSQLATVIEGFPPFGQFEPGGVIASRAGSLLAERGSTAERPSQSAWKLIEQNCPGYKAFKGRALFGKNAEGNIGLLSPKEETYALAGERPFRDDQPGRAGSTQGNHAREVRVGSRGAPTAASTLTEPTARQSEGTSPPTLASDLVTLLSCDVGLSARKLLFERSYGEITQYGGDPQPTDNGFIALFGAPDTEDEHVQRALMAALAIQRSFKEQGNASDFPSRDFPVRIGIHTGSYEEIQDTTKIAVELGQLANGGMILVSDATRRLARGYRFERFGGIDVRGVGDVIRAFCLVDASDRSDLAKDAEPPSGPEPEIIETHAVREQRPAPYRFTIRDDGKVDVLPEVAETQDRAFALDTYDELIRKAREAQQRIAGSNAAPRVQASIERLLATLGVSFDNLRPALLLSHEHSISADRNAFGDELSADAIAMMDDLWHTLRDLLALFPQVRRVEAERVALELDRNPEAIPTIRRQMVEIKDAAAASEIATEATISALGYNDEAIADATDPIERGSLIGYSLLVCRNFLGAVASYGSGVLAKAGAEAGELAGKSWQELKTELPKGVGVAARTAPLIALIGVAGYFIGPVTDIAVAITSFKPILETLRHIAPTPPPKPPTPAKSKKAGRTAP